MTTTIVMPCLRCGKPLDAEAEAVVCVCGATFVKEQVEFYSKPGYYREWIAALSCACGRVDHYTENGVAIAPHKCFAGGIMNMPSPFNN